jgi:hypothetical protein
LEGASLPPDRTTFLPLPLATKVAQVIPPYRSVNLSYYGSSLVCCSHFQNPFSFLDKYTFFMIFGRC